ncbi:hypothetical protein POM88_052112 [Heracleum sosnowskyi]|uniref:Uncharacterized protein n=1 Tax=Heracleum sosnowskyi TaxID=360622 RepID=A0AAD8LZ58_9APIA|nr:hypothetical protein POM88_052112 [Heracleum sosnowskyi]
MDHSPNEGDDDNYQVEEDGFDDDFAMELEQELAHNEGDSEDELVMELEQSLSDYEGDTSLNPDSSGCRGGTRGDQNESRSLPVTTTNATVPAEDNVANNDE